MNSLADGTAHLRTTLAKVSRPADLWMLDTEADVYAWTKITPTSQDVDPLPRGGASMSVVQGKVWMFGGQDPLSGICFSDFVVLDPATWEWSRPQPRGDPPPSRHSHVAGVIKDRVIVIFGGAGVHGPLGDTWLFDTETLTWMRPTVSGQAPAPREMAAACILKDGRLFVHGGRGSSGAILSDAVILDVDAMRWGPARHTEYAMCAHTAVSLMVVYGDEDEGADDGSRNDAG